MGGVWKKLVRQVVEHGGRWCIKCGCWEPVVKKIMWQFVAGVADVADGEL